MLEQLLDHLDIVGFGEELRHGIADHLADALDARELQEGRTATVLARRFHLFDEILGVIMGPCKRPRRRLPDMPDAQRIDEPIQADRPPGIYRIEQIAGARLAPAFAGHEALARLPVALLQRENVGRRLQETVGEELLDDLLAKPFDVESMPRHEMPEPLDALGR